MKKYRNPREKDDQVKKNIKMEVTELRKKTFNQQANFSGNTCYITRIPKENRNYGNFGRYHGK